MPGPVLQDSTFRQIRDFIYGKCGIYVADVKKYLIENRLAHVLQEKDLHSYEEYLAFIQNGCNGRDLARLYDAITTNETFFFREPQHLDLLIDTVLRGPLSQRRAQGLKIWCAACSTGEEPYTLRMALIEKAPSLNVAIVGSDISETVLESARRGVFTSYSVRNVAPPYLKKYFTVNGHQYELSRTVRDSVKFLNVNLMDEKAMRTVRDNDVIFCRNVLIYFDDKAKQKAVSLLYDCLKPGGYLYIGASESLHNVTRAFKPHVTNKVVVYQRS
ncbi:MAG: protein-glutamate O-methyltransferase CheR [Nitrospiraceae bacterium]|nr:protein-glutamate O-methyltransferase CheR [Nitrospiraceae bacterium]